MIGLIDGKSLGWELVVSSGANFQTDILSVLGGFFYLVLFIVVDRGHVVSLMTPD